MTSRPVVHVLEDVHPTAMERLRTEAEILTAEIPFPSRCDAVIVRARTITAEEIAACPNLKVIGKHGAGLDAIDVEAARRRDVAVLSTPGANAEAVADLAVGFALSLLRNIHTVTLATKAGTPLTQRKRQGWDLGELKAGIVGIGATGRATARRLIGGFGTAVQAYDPGIPEEAWPDGIEKVGELPNLLRRSQILFLHAPLLPATRNAIDAAALASMPRGAYVVNCARGGIVDEAALADALHSGHLAGAASDVFAEEPPAPDNPLFACPDFLASPHLGGSTDRALRRVGLSIAEQVLDRLRQSRAAAPRASGPSAEENRAERLS